MSSMLYYSNPIPLDKQKHKNAKLKRQDSYAFAEESNSLPVAGFEFFKASRNFPIFFVKNANDTYVPIAILSLRPKGHDLGPIWEDSYVPVYVRRYPFVLSTDGLVLFDEAAPHIQEEEGDALFNEDGEPSDTTKDIIKFLETSAQGYKMTEEFCAALAEKEILELFEGTIKAPEGSVNLGQLYAINEKKLHEALDEKEVNDWFQKGWIGWSHAHLHSIDSIHEVVKRARKAGVPLVDNPQPEAPAETENA